jgi:predicted metalloprotease
MSTTLVSCVYNAESTGLIEPLTEADVADALDAASVIGDDRVQETMGGGVDPESWTHGSSEQRMRWFRVGYETGDANQCDTFAAAGSDL